MPGGMQVAEPFSDEAMLFTKELVLQREVSETAWHSGPGFIVSKCFSTPLPVLVFCYFGTHIAAFYFHIRSLL